MNVNVRDFLARQWPVMNAHREVRCRERLSKSPLDFCNPVHQGRSLLMGERCQPLHRTVWNHKCVAFPAWKNVKKGLPPFSFGNFVRRNLTRKNALEERGHASASNADVFVHCGGRTQWPPAPFLMANVPVEPSRSTVMW